MYCVGIYSVAVMGVLGIHKSTKMKLSFVAQEKKCWTNIIRQIVAPKDKSLCVQEICRKEILYH
jgi:hypothetical protein